MAPPVFPLIASGNPVITDGLQLSVGATTLLPGNDPVLLYFLREGTAADDVMHGLSGNDFMRGYAGNDILDGREGSDILTAALGPIPWQVGTATILTGSITSRT